MDELTIQQEQSPEAQLQLRLEKCDELMDYAMKNYSRNDAEYYRGKWISIKKKIKKKHKGGDNA